MNTIKPYLCLVLFAFITGTTFQVAKEALFHFSPAQTGALRFVLASILLFVFVFLSDRKLLKVNRENLKSLIFLGIVGVFGFNFFFFLGMRKASPVNAAIIVALSPAITIFLSYLLLKTKITILQYVGTAVSFIGVLVVISDGNLNSVRTVLEGEGILFIFLAAICWALYSVGMKKYLKGVSTVQITTFTSFFGTICLLLLIIFSGDYHIDWSKTPTSAWFAILYMAAFTTFFGYLFWNYGIQKVGPDKAAIFGNLIPVVAMLTTWFLGESLNVFDIVGAILVIVGIFVVNSKFGRNAATQNIKTSTVG
ncbi:DMT family transporter [Leptospira stimsonii]|uniref:EamA/RhaT family transporter n=1 Tax=Leptospira stimsonii TaxID=2202203 RepID=A0ABY2MX32_9LEPT|nr:EamA family transporter [Leptospira stimsonii]TGK23737.1 EamA/RhaT family transporter [Leptospira stimsonii]TGM10555.1 EamA/RhaT family transporter [Leptospira stimsonii]